jgi:hypothetical protein
MSDRALKRCVRPAKNDARCEASCTESVKASSFRSSRSTWSEPNMVVIVTDASEATARPMNNTEFGSPQAGHV